MNTYPKYPERHILSLDGEWDFKWLGEGNWEEIAPDGLVYDEKMPVPGVFDTTEKYAGQRGIAVYRKSFSLDADAGRLKLKINGMGLLGKIWFDGQSVGEYKLPYSGLEYNLPSGSVGEHEIVIAVDNRFDPERMPLFLPNYDFYAYGGIYRSVEIHSVPELSIDRLQVTPLDLNQGIVKIRIKLDGTVPEECSFTLGFDGKNKLNVTEKVIEQNIELELQVPECRTWSPESPELHTVEVELGSDSICERFGMRTVEAKDGKIVLNGEPIRLRGFNRHEAHPELGPVQTEQLMADDLKLMKKMNCNFIRCVHYPQDQRFLDLCDEYGFLVWEETLGWGNKAEQLADPDFASLNEEQAHAMVANSFNHPSIIMWGFLNEAESNKEEARPLYKNLTGILREEGGSRLITYASNRAFGDVCFEFADVISLNIYPGWIGNSDWNRKATDCVAPYVKQLIDESCRDNRADKPLMFSEIGACAVPGWHDSIASQWTEEFQAEYLEQAITSILGSDRVSGLTIWQFCDTRSYGPYGQVRTKPFGVNFAGVLDATRRPKISSLTVETLYGERQREKEGTSAN